MNELKTPSSKEKLSYNHAKQLQKVKDDLKKRLKTKMKKEKAEIEAKISDLMDLSLKEIFLGIRKKNSNSEALISQSDRNVVIFIKKPSDWKQVSVLWRRIGERKKERNFLLILLAKDKRQNLKSMVSCEIFNEGKNDSMEEYKEERAQFDCTKLSALEWVSHAMGLLDGKGTGNRFSAKGMASKYQIGMDEIGKIRKFADDILANN